VTLAMPESMLQSPVVAEIIRSCLDDERTLVQEGRRVGDRQKGTLSRLADERRRFAETLERLNGQTSRESWGAIVRELGSGIWSRAAGRNVADAIEACRQSQNRIEVLYEKALAGELPSEIKATLMSQHERVVAAREELLSIEY
jgi:hypothetical protein